MLFTLGLVFFFSLSLSFFFCLFFLNSCDVNLLIFVLFLFFQWIDSRFVYASWTYGYKRYVQWSVWLLPLTKNHRYQQHQFKLQTFMVNVYKCDFVICLVWIGFEMLDAWVFAYFCMQKEWKKMRKNESERCCRCARLFTFALFHSYTHLNPFHFISFHSLIITSTHTGLLSLTKNNSKQTTTVKNIVIIIYTIYTVRNGHSF